MRPKTPVPLSGCVSCRSLPWPGFGSRWRRWTGCGHTAASAVVPRVSNRPGTSQRRGTAPGPTCWCGHVTTAGRSTESWRSKSYLKVHPGVSRSPPSWYWLDYEEQIERCQKTFSLGIYLINATNCLFSILLWVLYLKYHEITMDQII